MRDLLFHVQPTAPTSLQAQIREKIVTAIVDGQLPEGDRMPSSRQLAHDLKVSRNTVTLAYQSLVDDGFLAGRERSGYFVGHARLEAAKPSVRKQLVIGAAAGTNRIDWRGRIKIQPSSQANLNKPEKWSQYPYPFIYGQVDAELFPIAEWRDCARQAMGRRWVDDWAADHHANDDPMLVEQVRTRLLPRRGVMAAENEILITMGAQQALYLLSALLISPMTTAAFENPGYPDVRNIFALATKRLIPLAVDRAGLVVDERLDGCDVVYTTPSHQAPTTVTMTEARRLALLDKARQQDFVIIEDDYEFETNYVCAPLPALKSLDRDGRVIYVGSLSKTIFPGLRLGYLVGPKALIDEARALRRLMVRHPPTNCQRTAALFLQFGHHDAMILKLRRAYGERWRVIGEAIEKHLPMLERNPSHGGSSMWLKGVPVLDTDALAAAALAQGVVTEPGSIFFAGDEPKRNYLRLGFSSIDAGRIEEGIKILAKLMPTRSRQPPAAPRGRVTAAARG
jgi:GntR family transcriptional regulator / MocR family aminotransferase